MKDNVQGAKLLQIVPFEVKGEWNLDRGDSVFVLTNNSEIEDTFCNLFK